MFFFGWHCLPWDYESLAFISDTDCSALWEQALRTLWHEETHSSIARFLLQVLHGWLMNVGLCAWYWCFSYSPMGATSSTSSDVCIYRLLIHFSSVFLIQMGNSGGFCNGGSEINANACYPQPALQATREANLYHYNVLDSKPKWRAGPNRP